MIKKLISTAVNGFLAGIAISIGGALYIMTKVYTDNTVLAAVLFSIGLILVCNFGFFLYTGKILNISPTINSNTNPLFFFIINSSNK